jgi:hypothetical protein
VEWRFCIIPESILATWAFTGIYSATAMQNPPCLTLQKVATIGSEAAQDSILDEVA